jgi:hypothetical protein
MVDSCGASVGAFTQQPSDLLCHKLCHAVPCCAVPCCAVPCCAAAGGPSTRLATVAFGAGFGAGSAWQACARDVSLTKPTHKIGQRVLAVSLYFSSMLSFRFEMSGLAAASGGLRHLAIPWLFCKGFGYSSSTHEWRYQQVSPSFIIILSAYRAKPLSVCRCNCNSVCAACPPCCCVARSLRWPHPAARADAAAAILCSFVLVTLFWEGGLTSGCVVKRPQLFALGGGGGGRQTECSFQGVAESAAFRGEAVRGETMQLGVWAVTCTGSTIPLCFGWLTSLAGGTSLCCACPCRAVCRGLISQAVQALAGVRVAVTVRREMV